MNKTLSSIDTASHSPLELTPDLVAEISTYVTNKIIAHLKSLPDQPTSDHKCIDALIAHLNEPLPEFGDDYRNLVDLIFDEVATKGFNSTSPGYMAFIPGGGLIHTALADLISDSINRYVGVWVAAPGLVKIESQVIRWFCDIVGYPAAAGGFLTTGGSLANFSALFTARRQKLPDNFLSGTIYASDQTHHSVRKAAVLAGFPEENVRSIPSDSDFRMNTTLLSAQIQRDRREGKQPFTVVANAGTTNTGAIDDLDEIADLCEKENLWLHIDAAYGGFFMLTERGKFRMQGLNRADSITLDPHKGLFLSYGTGCLIVRNQKTLKQAHESHGDYMPTMQDEPDRVDFCQISPELSRDFRGLRVWLPIKMHGTKAFASLLNEKLDLIEWISVQLKTIDQIEIIAEPQLTVVTFRWRSMDSINTFANELTQQLLEKINSYQRVLLTGTWLGKMFVIRICILSFRTHRDKAIACVEDIHQACKVVENFQNE